MNRVSCSRRSFLKQCGATFLAGSLLPAGCKAQTQSGPNRKPNILFILTDDHRWDALGCVNPIVITPNMDQLAHDGILFNNMFVTTSICCTSRASIFTGQYASRHGIHNFSKNFTPEQLSQTYPALLQQNGYRTGFIGKYGVGNKMPADQFDYWKGFPGQGQYEKNKDENGQPIHLTRLMGNQAVEFLEGCSREQPFCLSISFKAPHCQDGDPRQFLYDPAYKDLYQDTVIPPAPRGSQADWDRFPEFFKASNEARNRWEIRFSTPELYQEMVKGYYRLIYGVDVQLGRIRSKLQEMGVADNTIIVLTGDNGFYLGEHGLAGKWYAHEESIRVPLIIYDPRQPKSQQGRHRDDYALNIDIAPTLLAYAGITAPANMQGRDISALLKNKIKSWRQDFYYEHLFNHAAIPKSQALVTKHYKYIQWIDQDPVYEELYDLQTDPGEIRNEISNPQYQSILNTLRARFETLKRKAK